MYIWWLVRRVTNQEIGKQNRHDNQKGDEQYVSCWVVKKVSFIEDGLVINFSGNLEHGLGYCISRSSKCS